MKNNMRHRNGILRVCTAAAAILTAISIPAASIAQDALYRITDEQSLFGEIMGTGSNETCVLIDGGRCTMTETDITRSGSSEQGTGSAVYVTGGTASIFSGHITCLTDHSSGAVAGKDGTVFIRASKICTDGKNAPGICTEQNGTIYGESLTISTHGAGSAVIACTSADGVMEIAGGTYISYAEDSPALYTVSDMLIEQSVLTANASEAVHAGPGAHIRLNNCVLTGNMNSLQTGENAWNVRLDGTNTDDGQCLFEMTGGTLNTENGGIFKVSGDSRITLQNVYLLNKPGCEYLLRCESGPYHHTFTAVSQNLLGDIEYDASAHVDILLTKGSCLTGSTEVITYNDEQSPESIRCDLYVDGSSAWIVSGNSRIASLTCSGIIMDRDGNSVSIVSPDGTIYVEGISPYTITCDDYKTTYAPEAEPDDLQQLQITY